MVRASRSERVFEPGRRPMREALEENLRAARHVARTARHKAEGAVAEVALNIRRHPLRVVAGAAVLAGVVLGLAAACFARTQR